MIPKLEPCKYCNGSGRWETECCNGADNCSCRGDTVDMGECRVCCGTGKLESGKEYRNLNAESIQGMCFIGTSLTGRTGFWRNYP